MYFLNGSTTIKHGKLILGIVINTFDPFIYRLPDIHRYV